MGERQIPLRRILVLAGARSTQLEHQQAASGLGQLLAGQGRTIIYGGARVGLMGLLADGALAAGGEVIGVITEELAGCELAHEGLDRLIVVETLHQRSEQMLQQADGVIALPGGLGTMAELLEAATWTQLGLQQIPIGILNVANYFDPLLQMLDGAVTDGFLAPEHLDSVIADTDPQRLLQQLEEWTPPPAKYQLSNGSAGR